MSSLWTVLLRKSFCEQLYIVSKRHGFPEQGCWCLFPPMAKTASPGRCVNWIAD